jgi:hypothetical protein
MKTRGLDGNEMKDALGGVDAHMMASLIIQNHVLRRSLIAKFITVYLFNQVFLRGI